MNKTQVDNSKEPDIDFGVWLLEKKLRVHLKRRDNALGIIFAVMVVLLIIAIIY